MPKEINLEKLVQDYRSSLMLYNYETKLVAEYLDTLVTEQQSMAYYNTKKEEFEIVISSLSGLWLEKMLSLISVKNKKYLKFDDITNLYEEEGLADFELFIFNKPVNILFEKGLILV